MELKKCPTCTTLGKKCVNYIELRTEAINHIKKLKYIGEKDEKWGLLAGDGNDCKFCLKHEEIEEDEKSCKESISNLGDAICVIKHFFNITEEDLK